MAKSDSFFGLRRGSTKTLTFSVLKGKQITKDRVEGGRNPRTPEQMVQRMCMATASAAYAHMKQIVDHSFEGITYGQTTMSEFIRVNADALRTDYYGNVGHFAFNPYRDRSLYFGEFVMSRGSVPSAVKALGVGYPGYQAFVSATAHSNLEFQLQVADAVDSLTANAILSACGLQVGDMLTLCALYEQVGTAANGFTFIRVRCVAGGDVAITADNIGDYFIAESPYPVTVSVASKRIQFAVLPDNYATTTGGTYCAIRSKKGSNGWLRSSESMEYKPQLDYAPSGEDALATYPLGPSYVLNGGDI